MCNLNPLLSLFDTLPFFILAQLIAIGVTIYTTILLVVRRPAEQFFLPQIKKTLLLILLASICEDLAWLVNILKLTCLPTIDLRLVILIIRIAWIFSIIQYQAFGFFIEALLPNQSKFLLLINRITLFISTVYCLKFSWLILFKTYNLERTEAELGLFEDISYTYMPILILIYLIFTLSALSDHKLPKTIRSLLYTFMLGLIGPTMLVDTIHIYQPTISFSYFKNNEPLVAMLALFIAISAYFCVKHILFLDHNYTKQPDCFNQ